MADPTRAATGLGVTCTCAEPDIKVRPSGAKVCLTCGGLIAEPTKKVERP